MTELEQAKAFMAWLESEAGRELCSTRKGKMIIHELAVDAALIVKRAEIEAN